MTKVDSLQKGFFTKSFPPTVSWLSGVPYTGDSIWVWNGEHGNSQHIDFFEIDDNSGDTVLRGDTYLSHTPWIRPGINLCIWYCNHLIP